MTYTKRYTDIHYYIHRFSKFTLNLKGLLCIEMNLHMKLIRLSWLYTNWTPQETWFRQIKIYYYSSYSGPFQCATFFTRRPISTCGLFRWRPHNSTSFVCQFISTISRLHQQLISSSFVGSSSSRTSSWYLSTCPRVDLVQGRKNV